MPGRSVLNAQELEFYAKHFERTGFPKGQAALTGLSVVLSLSTVFGLEGRPPAPVGLYFPELLMDANWFLNELAQAGGSVVVDSN